MLREASSIRNERRRAFGRDLAKWRERGSCSGGTLFQGLPRFGMEDAEQSTQQLIRMHFVFLAGRELT
jgi:hypothetical protein